MKKLKRILAIMMVFIMTLALALPMGSKALAHDITLTGSNNAGKHSYSAYQIFGGTVDGDKLLDIVWGNPFNVKVLDGQEKTFGDLFIEELKKNDLFGKEENNLFKDCEDAEDVAGKITSFKDDSEQAFAFAKAAGKFIDKQKTAYPTKFVPAGQTSANPAKISNLADGYYIVLDDADMTAQAVSGHLLQLIGKDQTITVKEALPTLDKEILSPNLMDKMHNTASIGDSVKFQLTSKVPNMKGYTKYFFVVNDIMTEGLTYDPESIVIKIGENKTLEYGKDYKVYVYERQDKSTRVEIVFQDFIQWNTADYVGKNITITYSAILNEDADLTSEGNLNTVDLTYSKNPNVDAKGDGNPDYEPEYDDPENPDVPKYDPDYPDGPDTPDTPEGSDEPSYNYDDDRPKPEDPHEVGEDPEEPGPPDLEEGTDKTQEKTTVTYAASVRIIKTDVNKAPLAGVEFELKADTKGKMTKDEEGLFYKNTDGTYTLKPNGTTDKYKFETDDNGEVITIIATATSGADGYIMFKGLGVGTYTITETKALDGYNKLNGSLTLTIGATKKTNPESGDVQVGDTGYYWTASLTPQTSDEDVSIVEDRDNGYLIQFTVVNTKGINLPTTGGIGTTLFYLLGSMMVVCAGLYLVMRKRMSADEI